MGELIFNALVAVVAVILYVLTFSFPTSIFDKSGGAAMYPRIVIIFLLVLLLIRSLQILRHPDEKAKKFVFLEMFKGPRLIYILTTLAYFLLVKHVGFILSTIVYLIWSISYFYCLQEAKRPSGKVFAIICVVVIPSVVILDYVFCTVLGVLLPAGIIGF